MKQQAGKIISALLALAICLSLGACGKGNSASEAGDSGSSSKTQEKEFKSKYADKTDIDLGGRIITIANEKWWKPSNSNMFMDKIVENIEYFEDLWNFKIEYTYPAGDSAEYHEKLSTSVLSGNPVADIAWVDSTYLFPGFIASGVVQNVTDLNVFDFTEKKWNNKQMDAFASYKNKHYGIYSYGFTANNYYTDVGYGVFFNRDYFEENSLPDLYKLVREDKWTWDKMIEVAKQATTTTNGVKTYGLTVWQDAFPFIGSCKESIVTDNKDGTYTFNATNNSIISALEYYFANAATTLPVGTELYPWIHPHTGEWDFPGAAFKNNEAAILAAPWSCLDWYLGSLNFDWGFVPFPKQSADDIYRNYSGGANFWCLLSNIKNPEEVAMVYDAITDIEYTDDDYEYFFENQASDDETVEMIGILLEKGEIKYDMMFQIPSAIDNFWGAFDSVRQGTATPTSAMQSIKDVEQAKIDEVANRLASSVK